MYDHPDLIVLILHPDIDPSLISEQLCLEPSLTHLAGDQVITPRGQVVTGSKYHDSRWQYTIPIDSEADLQKELFSLVKLLCGHSAFLRKIASEGGKTDVFFTATDQHVALVIGPALMKMMAESDISFGFEFFTN